MPAPALIAARFGAWLADTASVGGERGSRALPITFARVHKPDLPCPARRCRRKPRARCASRSFRCALVALPDGVGWRHEVKHTGTACWPSSPAAEDFRVARGLPAGRVIVQGVNMPGEARRRMAHGSGGARKDLPARCGRDSGWVARGAASVRFMQRKRQIGWPSCGTTGTIRNF